MAEMPHLYIIAGCNGAGKTTASYTILPEILGCREFVSAGRIAVGLSPFNPESESVTVAAGRIMLERIQTLMEQGVDFAFETTLAMRNHASLIEEAQKRGYEVTLLYSPEFPKSRVEVRVMAESPPKNIHELSEKIIVGISKAVRELIEKTAAEGGTLVIGDKDGSFKKVPAKDLLKNRP